MAGNQILRLLPASALETITPWLDEIQLRKGDLLFEAGDDLEHVWFPLDSTVVALVLPMSDGRAVEAATIGREGAVGGLVSTGGVPAFARGSVQIPGRAVRIPLSRLEGAKRHLPSLHDTLARYTDCLIAHVLQTVGCATVHPLEARCARWLLMTHDRIGQAELPVTQEALAEMFGVARTYVTRMANALRKRGAISYSRGVLRIEGREALEEVACECYAIVRNHFDCVLPGLYPTEP